ncbi:phage/plasmid primase, P4 family [Stieleria sp. TO1_6]|uniref:DNA primase family protein n=1 Tax=Stieleria tagensis TaxID=2956795 RepID=UPI00209BB30A|nr:DNA primase family protein [Stieleria tagensis]MCO8121322.1 phage/plasmid primase, P4 family [Stieleria tagensis]
MPKLNKKDQPKSPEIVREFLERHIVTSYRGEFHLYNGKFYELMSKGSFRSLVATFIVGRFGSDAATHRMTTECVGLLADLTHLEIKSQPTWLSDASGEIASVLVVDNGVLDASPMYDGGDPRLVPHTPDLFATSKTELTYEPKAKCSKFDEFLDWFACGDSGLVLLILQFMAYVVLRRLDLQRFVVLRGSGSNGKSVLLKTLQHLAGALNCSALSIERLGGRFNLAALTDKSVNVAADANEITKVAEGNLKMLVDGSELTFERKHQDPYNAVCFTRLIFACNVFPRFRDRSDGLWRRLLVIPCIARVTGGDVRRGIEQTFNMAGVLNRVLEAGAKLIADGDFSIPQCVIDANDRERFEANPAMTFLREHLVEEAEAFCGTDELYAVYGSWCESCGYKPLHKINFGKEVAAFSRQLVAAGLARTGKSKDRPRRNGYWGYALAPYGKDDYVDQRNLQRQQAIKDTAKSAEREARNTELAKSFGEHDRELIDEVREMAGDPPLVNDADQEEAADE